MRLARENMLKQKEIAKQEWDEKTQIQIEGLEQKRVLQEAEIELVAGLGDVLHSMAGKNREAAYSALIVEKAAAVGQIVSNVGIANAKALAMFPATAGQPFVTINTAMGALLVARIISETTKAARDINSSFKQSKVPKYENGGRITQGVYVNTGGKDDTLILANKTETILTEKQIAALGGSRVMKAIGVRGFENGGAIGSMPYINPAVPPLNMEMFNRVLEAFENRIDRLQVHNDLHKVRAGLNEIETTLTHQRI